MDTNQGLNENTNAFFLSHLADIYDAQGIWCGKCGSVEFDFLAKGGGDVPDYMGFLRA